MFLLDWLTSLLRLLGLSSKKARIVILGVRPNPSCVGAGPRTGAVRAVRWCWLPGIGYRTAGCTQAHARPFARKRTCARARTYHPPIHPPTHPPTARHTDARKSVCRLAGQRGAVCGNGHLPLLRSQVAVCVQGWIMRANRRSCISCVIRRSGRSCRQPRRTPRRFPSAASLSQHGISVDMSRYTTAVMCPSAKA